MAEIRIYHNTRCTKSNQALNYLNEKGYVENVEVILYLENPLSKETVSWIADHLIDDISLLIRQPEAKELGIDIPKSPSKTWIVKTIVKYPKVMQRPIVVANGKAVIARPTERIDEVV